MQFAHWEGGWPGKGGGKGKGRNLFLFMKGKKGHTVIGSCRKKVDSRLSAEEKGGKGNLTTPKKGLPGEGRGRRKK